MIGWIRCPPPFSPTPRPSSEAGRRGVLRYAEFWWMAHVTLWSCKACAVCQRSPQALSLFLVHFMCDTYRKAARSPSAGLYPALAAADAEAH